jgi:formimidoylglutamate deiminase
MSTVLQADYTYFEGRLQAGVVVHIDSQGHIDRITRSESSVDSIRRDTSPSLPALSLETTNPGEFALPRARRKHRLRGKVLFPGFINGHSHCFQRLMRGRAEHRPPGKAESSFWTWRDAMYKISETIDADEFEHVATFAFMEMLRAGFTHVAEFHYLHHQFGGHPYEDPAELSRRLFRAAEYAGIGITVLPVAYSRGGHEQVLTHAQRRFAHADIKAYTDLFDEAREHIDVEGRRTVNVGLAAHSVRALDRDFLSELSALKQDGNYLCHAHVSEQLREIEECLAEHGLRPVELLGELGFLDDRFTAVHATHLSAAEVNLLGEAKVTACICPTTERNLGDGLPQLREMIDAGVELAIGTDSQVRIDPFAEVRALEDGERLRVRERSVITNSAGQVAPSILEIGTLGGARSVGLQQGQIAVGQIANMISVDVKTMALTGVSEGTGSESSLLAGIMLTGHPAQVRDVWVGGRHIVIDGEVLRWEAARSNYLAVARKLWS